MSYKDVTPVLRSRTHARCPEEEIVISGISGRFPNSDNISEFAKNLYNKVDLIDDDERRWRHTYAEIPKRSGKINHLEKFDATFFGVHFKQAHTMDPQSRLLVERAYEAVLDAGINPKSLRGSRTGVFIGACFSESEKTWFYEKVSTGGFGITGCSRAMMANRISYSLGLQGPSLLSDTACSSSMTALDIAFSAMRNGECDAAIVGGANLLLHPYVTLQFARLGVLSMDGYCRPFDKDGKGYTRSEAICCIFLQQAKDAKRIYAKIIYSKINCDGYKEEGITYPSGQMQRKLLTEFYQEVGIDPRKVDFMEAHSTGTLAGDPEECSALDAVFCTGREKPLPVGSVKSNIGHSESASGTCSIAKVIIAMENDLIPPNINFTAVRPGIPALLEGRLEVVTEPTKLDGPLIGVNSFGFGGANAHALLEANPKSKVNHGEPQDDLPRLVIWSGRTEEAVNEVLDFMVTRPLDAEFVGLLHSTQMDSVSGNVFRSYGLYRKDPNGGNAICLSREAQHYTGVKRPAVWVFSGMGSQWCEMGTSLMNMPMFRKSIERCHEILKPKKLDLIGILTSTDPTTYDNILHSFVGIAAIQIALVDILKSLDLEPDYIIGHSVGELGCAYADGCFTAEEMILAAYCRGKVSVETEKIFGSMAAVGLGFRKIRSLLPPGIEVACHNSPDSCTISGPADAIEKFVAELKSQGIFAKEVPCSNIAYHSRYIADMGPKLKALLTEVIPEPKKRSPRWLSTSVPKQRWDYTENHYSSAQYHTNNLLNSVLFEETSAMLPNNAITIEVAPHGLLQAILKKSMPNAVHTGLAQRGNKDNIQFLFTALGKIYMNGVDIPIDRMYPPVQFPVSRGTPMISPLIKWDHSEDWYVTKFEALKILKSGERRCKVQLTMDDYEYISGHTIDGRILFPATGYLHLVWETYGMMKGDLFFDMEIEFTDVRFLRATNMTKDTEIEFLIMIQPGTGRFEITEGSSAVVTGLIKQLEPGTSLISFPDPAPSKYPMLQAKDFYKELRLRGYQYNGFFRAVHEARGDGLVGKVKFEKNWVPFLDCLLQVHIVGQDSRSLMLPTRIQRMRINGRDHMNMFNEENPYFDVKVSKELNIISSGGVEIVGLHASPVARRRPPGVPVLETYKFIPHLPTPEMSKIDAIRTCVQLALENNPNFKVKVVEVDTNESTEPIITFFQEALGDLPLVSTDLMYLTAREIELQEVHVENGKLSTQTNCMFVIASDCLANPDFVEKSVVSLTENAYLVTRESKDLHVEDIKIPPGFQLILSIPTEDETIVMCHRLRRKLIGNPTVVKISMEDTKYEWLNKIRAAMKTGPVTLVSEGEPTSGIIGLVNCLRKEPDGYLISCVFVDDSSAPPFDFDNPYFKAHLKLSLAINVCRGGRWGSYRHLKLEQVHTSAPTKQHCFANVLTRGDLTSLSWLHGGLSERYFDEEGVVHVMYSSLNFRDIMLATGKLAVEVVGSTRLEQECVLGFEYSGIDNRGRRVMGMVNCGALGTHLISDEKLTFNVPDHWTLQEAATVPVVYLTVYIAFFISTTIKKGKSILIHAGTGGVGMAAIRTAFEYGLDVYTTVSTPEKKKFLLEKFPKLKESHIGNSRNTTFEKMIMLQTKGKGVDYVLNSLSDDKLHASVRCLGIGGKFLEIGKFDMANDTKLGLGVFLREISFCAVLADNLFKTTSDYKEYLFNLIRRDIDSGIIIPLPSTVFEAQDVEKAFRFLASGKHMGKVLLKIRENEKDKLTYPITITPRVNCDFEFSYIIPGGLGGFGLELADWLVIRGARKLVLSSSRGITKQYQAYRIRIWETYGAKIVVSTANIATREGCQQLIQQAAKLGPVGGIFNLAVVLRDSILENQNEEKFTESMAPKAIATKYLDELTRTMCPHLQQFVVFSSVSCGRGNAGQCNYGMANSVMERIIEKRVADGLPGKAIQWGAVGEVGLVADMQEDKIDMEIGGTLQQRISSCLTELDNLLTTDDPIVASMVVAEKRAGSGGKGNIIETVMNIMSIRDIKSISMDATLSELGMDSLMAVEIKQTLEREFELFLTPQDLRSLTFMKLQELADSRDKDGSENVKLKLANDDKPVGMAMLLRNLGDETNSEKTILRVKSRDENVKYVSCALMIPGIEGVAGNAFYAISANISLPAFVLQLTHTIRIQSIPEIAKAVIEDIKNEVMKTSEFFYLVGYSFGAFITLEIARLLEESGMSGQILLIDGAPAFLKRLAIGQMTEDYTDETIQIVLISGIIRIIFPDENAEDLFARISELKTWEDRVNKLVELSKHQHVYSEGYLRLMADALLMRLKVILEADITNIVPLKCPITLVRPTEVSIVDIDEDYELSKYTTGPVNLKFIEGNHISMLENSKLPQIINDLDPKLESDKAFKKYLTN
ncbi:fatty acid synthase [Phlebotomus papatasi]|nr:fatty acid synthase [Phlebotomus papatasi]